MLWMLKVYRATDSDQINSWMNSLSIPFLAKCLSPEHQLLRVAVKTFCLCILASEVEEGVWDQSASSPYQYSCVYVNTDYLHGASILQLPPGMGPETSTCSTPSPTLHLSSHTEKGSGSQFSLLWEIIMHELIHAVSSGQTQVVGLIAWVLLSWITLCLLSLEVCIQIIAVCLLVRRSLLRCTNFITYLSKRRWTERAEREREGRKREGERLFATGVFSWRDMGVMVLTALLSFGAPSAMASAVPPSPSHWLSFAVTELLSILSAKVKICHHWSCTCSKHVWLPKTTENFNP